MNYYQPRKRESDSRWDYTQRNNDTIYAVGYCAPFQEWSEDSINMIFGGDREEYERHIQDFRDTAHKYHSGGHETEDEARMCYREYLLDHELDLGVAWSDTQHKCDVCGEWTNKAAKVGNSRYYELCDEHRNRAEVEKLFGPVGNICSS